MHKREAHLNELAQALQAYAPGRVFWSGVGFLDEVIKPLRDVVGDEWGAEAAEGYLSFQAFSNGIDNSEAKQLTLVLAAPCPPDQLAAVLSLHRAGYLACVVMLEHKKPTSLGGWTLPAPLSPLIKKFSATGSYLDEMGFHDVGFINWESDEKRLGKLAAALDMAAKYCPGYLVVLFEEEQVEYEIDTKLGAGYAYPKRAPKAGLDGMATVFERFSKHMNKLVGDQQLTLFDERDPQALRLLEGRHRVFSSMAPALEQLRPILVIPSAILPTLYPTLRLWCTSLNLALPIIIVFNSGLTRDSQNKFTGLNDMHLLLSIPELAIARPSDELEAVRLLEEALVRKGSTAIVFSQAPAIGLEFQARTDHSKQARVSTGGRLLRSGKDAIIFAIGSTVYPGLLAAESLQSIGLEVAVYDLRYQRPSDPSMVELAAPFSLVVTAEEGPRSSSISSSLYAYGKPEARLIQLSIEPAGLESYQSKEQFSPTLESFGLHGEGIARTIKDALKIGIATDFKP